MKSRRPSGVYPVIPPSITIVSPLMYAASSDARNSTVVDQFVDRGHPADRGPAGQVIDKYLFSDKPFIHAALYKTGRYCTERHAGF